nr:hypothetical protein [Tanacetum cinerariifolium]
MGISIKKHSIRNRSINSCKINNIGGAVRTESDTSIGAVRTEFDTSIGEDIEETSSGNDYEMEERAVRTESDTSIGKDIEETSSGNDYEMEESAEKDLKV